VIDPFPTPLQDGDFVIASTYKFKSGNNPEVTYYRFRKAGDPLVPVYDKTRLPALLFLSTSAMTLLTLFLLRLQLADLFLRTLLWFRWLRRYRLEVVRGNNVPAKGPLLLVSNSPSVEHSLQIQAALDRRPRLLLVERAGDPPLTGATRGLVSYHSWALVPPG